jgi:hypothetical protein
MFTSRLTKKTTSDAATARPVYWRIVSESTSVEAGRHTTPQAALAARFGADDALTGSVTTWSEDDGVYQVTKTQRYGQPLVWRVIVIR